MDQLIDGLSDQLYKLKSRKSKKDREREWERERERERERKKERKKERERLGMISSGPNYQVIWYTWCNGTKARRVQRNRS